MCQSSWHGDTEHLTKVQLVEAVVTTSELLQPGDSHRCTGSRVHSLISTNRVSWHHLCFVFNSRQPLSRSGDQTQVTIPLSSCSAYKNLAYWLHLGQSQNGWVFSAELLVMPIALRQVLPCYSASQGANCMRYDLLPSTNTCQGFSLGY